MKGEEKEEKAFETTTMRTRRGRRCRGLRDVDGVKRGGKGDPLGELRKRGKTDG